MVQSTFYMSDIIEKTGLPADDIALIRHSFGHKNFAKVWNAGREYFEEYQRIQVEDYFNGKHYVFAFVGDKGTTARLIGIYKVLGAKPLKASYVSKEYWVKFKCVHNENDYYFELEPLTILPDLQGRLVIDYLSVRNPVHSNWDTISKKPVVSISSNVFPGYENINWSYSELEDFVNHEIWHEELVYALSRVNGVYLIVDQYDYKQYIGSAFGEEGIWGRWKEYVKTGGTGGNAELKAIMNKNPKRKYGLKFCILEVIPKSGDKAADKNRAEKMEVLYKKKLLPQLNLN